MDFSWARSARSYRALYARLVAEPPCAVRLPGT
jgi:glycogen synthase